MSDITVPTPPGPSDEINYDVDYYGREEAMKQSYDQQMRLYKNTTDFSHVLGNLTEIIRQYIIQTMPPDYFKGSRATTEVAFKDYTNRRRDFIQLERPFLVIDPKLNMTQESESLPWLNWDRFVQIDQAQQNPNFYLMNHEWFMTPPDKSFYVGYTISRHRMKLDISMVVDSQMQRLSLENYLKSNFRMRHFYPIDRYTETVIPISYIKFIAKKWNMDIKSDDFLKALNKISQFTILRLNRPATDHTEFFILQNQTIQIKIPDYPEGERVMSNRVEKYSIVRFTMDIETNIMNNFLLLSSETIDNKEMMSDYMVRISMQSRAPEVPDVENKFTLYYKVTCEFDKPLEHMDLNEFTSYDTKPLIRYIQENGLEDEYVMVKVYKWEKEVDNTDNQVFEFDPKTFKFIIKAAEPEVVYNIAIFFDNNYLARIKTYVIPETTNIMGNNVRQGVWDKEEKLFPPSPAPTGPLYTTPDDKIDR